MDKPDRLADLKTAILERDKFTVHKQLAKALQEKFDDELNSDFNTNGLSDIDDDEERELIEYFIKLAEEDSAEDNYYNEGVLVSVFADKGSAIDYVYQIEDHEAVDYIEYEVGDNTYTDPDPIELDEDDLLEVYVTLKPEYYTINDDDLNERRMKTRVDSKGRKTRRVKCAKGMRWSSSKNACVRMSADEQRSRRRGARKASRTRARQGSSARKRATLKRNRAMRFRKQQGVKS